MFFVFVPSSMWAELLSDQILLIYGCLFLATSTIWSLWTDKAGRPWVQSTHKLLQAYLSAMSTKDPTEMEAIIEPSSKRSSVTTSQIKFQTESDKNPSLTVTIISALPFQLAFGVMINKSPVTFTSISSLELNAS